jgi:uncharacterized membrane-anchored protein
MDRSIGRRPYLSMMAVLFVAVPVAEWFGLAAFPSVESALGYVNAVCLCTVVLLTGWRLADAGYSPWLGFAGIVTCGIIGPAITLLIAMSLVPGPLFEEPEVLAGIALAWMLAMAVFVVWAGLRRSRQAPAVGR